MTHTTTLAASHPSPTLSALVETTHRLLVNTNVGTQILVSDTSVQVVGGYDSRPSADARALLALVGCVPDTIGVADEPEGREWSGETADWVSVYVPCRPLTTTGATR
jgi:hypothetical protein